MSEPKRAPGTAPWVLAGVLVLAVAALALLVAHTVAVRHDNARTAGAEYGPTADQSAAVQAGATEAANLTTFTRKNFAGDFARALKGATGNLRKDLLGQQQNTLSAMTSGKFDLRSTVVESAFVGEDGGNVLVLVTLNGRHVFDSGQVDTATPQRLQLTMVRSGGAWLAGNLISAGIQ